MSKILKIFVIVLFLLFSFETPILAIDCTYPDAELTISYDENGAKINSDFVKSEYYKNYFLFGTGSSLQETNQLNIDQNLWAKYKGVACPSGMKVCAVVRYSLNLITLKGLGASLVDGFFNSALISPHISDDLKNTVAPEAFNAVTFNKRELYVLTKEEYDKSDIKKFPNGVTFTNTGEENANVGYVGCGGDNDGVGWKLLGGLCAIGTGLGITIWDFITGDIKIAEIVDVNCQDVTYKGPYASFNINCGQLMNKMMQYMDKISNYKNCGQDDVCKSKSITDLNEIENNIKSQCSSILQNHDYDGVQKECIENCLNMKDILNDYRKDTDLYDDGSLVGECGFSDRLLIWVANIVRWIKYIVPVLVIILGILDFIKAIASDKDDEMKKAQGRFVKRLIAAALVFIVPFIIEFILDKMGFTVTGCGVIDL